MKIECCWFIMKELNWFMGEIIYHSIYYFFFYTYDFKNDIKFSYYFYAICFNGF